MIQSLLVANRGEIACRVFRTARRLGVRTIAVFSEADANARHVREADEAVCIGPAPPRESYLSIPRLLAAAKATGAQAIHPGYGFLSENAEFSRACAEAGLVFVGPPAAAIAAMGSKSVAKARMREAGVPVLPGYEGSEQSLAFLEARALELGWPLIIKPAAGGGGKGMRIVREQSELQDALAGARRLAESAFADGTLLLERYLTAPRHVEVQVFADSLGHIVHLGDRDCSIQRRHQKLIEEAPAPHVPDEVRARMRAAAQLVAREIGYVGAGTVEFLLDGAEFYFMEMNTRLQVEHTVTEAITGLDLVEWQLRVASGEPLPLAQERVQFSGHAIEARVCAENPQADFLPSAGSLHLLEWPEGEGVRVDAGFATGDVVPADYDSLLGKVIAWAPTREVAAARLANALEATCIAGVRTNERWLARVLRTARFRSGEVNIGFLRDCGDELARPTPLSPGAAAVASLAILQRLQEASGPWDSRDGYTPNLPATVSIPLSLLDKAWVTTVTFRNGQMAGIHTPGLDDLEILETHAADGVARMRTSSGQLSARWLLHGRHVDVWEGANHYELTTNDPRDAEFSATAARGGLTTPLPGVVVAVAVTLGQAVKSGDVLMVVEAMKMEHSILAPHDGVVTAIHFARGAKVPEGSVLLALETAG